MKKIAGLVTIVVSLIIIQNLASSIWNLWQKRDVVSQAAAQLEAQRQENAKLKKQLSQVQNPQFVEEEARDKLFLEKPGETQLLLPIASQSSTVQPKEENVSNFQQWVEVFFPKSS